MTSIDNFSDIEENNKSIKAKFSEFIWNTIHNAKKWAFDILSRKVDLEKVNSIRIKLALLYYKKFWYYELLKSNYLKKEEKELLKYIEKNICDWWIHWENISNIVVLIISWKNDKLKEKFEELWNKLQEIEINDKVWFLNLLASDVNNFEKNSDEIIDFIDECNKNYGKYVTESIIKYIIKYEISDFIIIKRIFKEEIKHYIKINNWLFWENENIYRHNDEIGQIFDKVSKFNWDKEQIINKIIFYINKLKEKFDWIGFLNLVNFLLWDLENIDDNYKQLMLVLRLLNEKIPNEVFKNIVLSYILEKSNIIEETKEVIEFYYELNEELPEKWESILINTIKAWILSKENIKKIIKIIRIVKEEVNNEEIIKEIIFKLTQKNWIKEEELSKVIKVYKRLIEEIEDYEHIVILFKEFIWKSMVWDFAELNNSYYSYWDIKDEKTINKYIEDYKIIINNDSISYNSKEKIIKFLYWSYRNSFSDFCERSNKIIQICKKLQKIKNQELKEIIIEKMLGDFDNIKWLVKASLMLDEYIIGEHWIDEKIKENINSLVDDTSWSFLENTERLINIYESIRLEIWNDEDWKIIKNSLIRIPNTLNKLSERYKQVIEEYKYLKDIFGVWWYAKLIQYLFSLKSSDIKNVKKVFEELNKEINNKYILVLILSFFIDNNIGLLNIFQEEDNIDDISISQKSEKILNIYKKLKENFNEDETGKIVSTILANWLWTFKMIDESTSWESILKQALIYMPNPSLLKLIYDKYIKNNWFTEENYDFILYVHLSVNLNGWIFVSLSEELKENIEKILDDNKNKIYTKVKWLYLSFLEKLELDEKLRILLNFFEIADFLNLSQINKLLEFIWKLKDLFKYKDFSKLKNIIKEWTNLDIEGILTKMIKFSEIKNPQEIKKILEEVKKLSHEDKLHKELSEELLNLLENYEKQSKTIADKIQKQLRIFEEKTSSLSNDEKSHFYSIMSEIIDISWELFSDYLELFNYLKTKDLKKFLSENLNLHNAYLILIKDNDSLKSEFLEFIKNWIKKLTLNCQTNKDEIQKDYEDMSQKIMKYAKKEFWIKKMPQELNEEIINNLKNFSIYYWNINEADENKKMLIWLALWLTINWLWTSFRKLEDIDFKEYFDEETAGCIEDYREELLRIFWDESFLDDLKRLQEEKTISTIWQLETIIQVLENIKWHKKNLEDKDNFDAETYKIFVLYKEHKGKLGNALSQKFENLTKWSKIHDESEKILNELWNISSIKDIKNIQEKLDIVKIIVSFIDEVDGLWLDEKLKEVNELLMHWENHILTFRKIGENFSSESWIMPIPQDVSYLIELLNSNKDKLSREEFIEVSGYLEKIKEEIGKLYNIFRVIEDIFNNKFLVKTKWENSDIWVKEIFNKFPILKERIERLRNEFKKLSTQNIKEMNILTTFTNSLTIVIENIRWCLWCLKKEVNNHTNLRFTAPNEFFIISRNDLWQKSFADQPVTLVNTDEWHVFILDTLRWEIKSKDIIISNILVLLEKINWLSDKNIWILLPPNAIEWITLNDTEIIDKINKAWFEITFENDYEVEADIPNQYFYEPYNEWWTWTQKWVKHNIKWKMIKLKT